MRKCWLHLIIALVVWDNNNFTYFHFSSNKLGKKFAIIFCYFEINKAKFEKALINIIFSHPMLEKQNSKLSASESSHSYTWQLF